MTESEYQHKVQLLAHELHKAQHAAGKASEIATDLRENLLELQAFRDGAEAMRTAILRRVDWHGSTADRIRDEPVPEYKP